MKAHARKLLRVFVTGLLAALPLAATIAIFAWAISFLFGWLGPNSGVGGVLVAIGVALTGSEVIGYLIGLLAVAAGILALGFVVEAGLQRGLASLLNAVMQRIPVVRTVYDLAQRMVDLFRKTDGEVKSMSPVWCHFGGPGGAAALGLLGSPEPVILNGQSYLAVLIPTAPVPVGGGLIYVPQAWVQPADVGIEALTSIYVSMGVTSGKHLSPPADPASAAAPPPEALR
jgi:uncharacterized membrane protein